MTNNYLITTIEREASKDAGLKPLIKSFVEKGSVINLNKIKGDKFKEAFEFMCNVAKKLSAKTETLERKVEEAEKRVKDAALQKCHLCGDESGQALLECHICDKKFVIVEEGICEKCSGTHEDESGCEGSPVKEKTLKCQECKISKTEDERLREFYRRMSRKRLSDEEIAKKKETKCPFLIRKNVCKKKNMCDFLHAFDVEEARKELKEAKKGKENELLPVDDPSKPRCRLFDGSGRCKFGRRCRFFHDKEAKFGPNRSSYHPYQNQFRPHPGHFQQNPGFSQGPPNPNEGMGMNGMLMNPMQMSQAISFLLQSHRGEKQEMDQYQVAQVTQEVASPLRRP